MKCIVLYSRSALAVTKMYTYNTCVLRDRNELENEFKLNWGRCISWELVRNRGSFPDNSKEGR